MNTKERLTFLKDEVNRNWDFFKTLHPDSEYFKTYMDLIGERLSEIRLNDSIYNPYWFSAFQKHSEKYWNNMRVRLDKQLSKMEYDTSIELQALDIYFAFNRTCIPFNEFKAKNVVCEFIRN